MKSHLTLLRPSRLHPICRFREVVRRECISAVPDCFVVSILLILMLRHTMFSLSNGYNVLSPYDYYVLSSFIAFVLLIKIFEYSPTQLFVSSGYNKVILFISFSFVPTRSQRNRRTHLRALQNRSHALQAILHNQPV